MPHPLRFLPALAAAAVAGLPLAPAGQPQPVPADHAAKMARAANLFKTHAGPLLKAHCLRCHGGKKTEGGLDLSNRDKLLTGGENGPAVVPGDAKKSLLYQLAAHQKEPHMPDGGEKLPAADLAKLAEWIDLGAAYDAPLTGADPKAAAPAAGSHWAFRPVKKPAVPAGANAIDHFVRAKLAAAGLAPAKPADRRTLVRRVTFDLTGLPPTPEEVEAFVADESPDAYETLIDRLLASPAYGDRWGRHWLDLVRYCDSFDARITGNSDMDCQDAWRYRDWVVKAVNADLPHDRFVRMQVAGDVLPMPDAERPDGIVATGMLALGNWGGGDADKEKLLTDIADDQIDVVGRSVMGLTLACARCHDHKFDPVTTRDYYALAGIFFSTHILPNVGPKTNGPPMLRIPLGKPPEPKAAAVLAKRSSGVAGEPNLVSWRGEPDCPNCVANATGAEAVFSTIRMPAKTVALHPGPQTDVAAVWTSPAAGEVRLSGTLADYDPNCGDGVGWELRHVPAKGEAKKLAAGAVANGKGGGFGKEAAITATVAAGDRLELVVKRNAEYTCDTTGVEFVVAGKDQTWDFAADWLAKLPDGEAKSAPWSVEEPGGPRPYTGPMANGAQEGGVPGSPHAGVHDVKIHIRGRYDRLGELVPRGFPEVIRVANPPTITAGSGRKELADWLTRPDHPLTARVIVNRVWQHHLGRGIVNTPSNFGLLGEKPTHPELLDWLAATFVEDGWSLKKLHKRILLTETYRQSAAGDAAAVATDPDNKLFGRFSRKRLEAEAIRDSLLVAAGKLDATRGGPAVRDFNSPRRTLYLMTIRSDRTGFGPLFDVADSTAPTDVRTVSTVAPQALFLLNHPFVKAQAAAFADRVMSAKPDTAGRLALAHRIALGRGPTPDELKLGTEFVAAGKDSREAWTAWCHLLVQANEFVVIE